MLESTWPGYLFVQSTLVIVQHTRRHETLGHCLRRSVHALTHSRRFYWRCRLHALYPRSGVARRRAVSERSVTHIRTRHTCCANALSPSPEARSSLVVDALPQHIRSRPSPQRQPPARCPPALPSVLDFPRPTPAHVNHSGFTAIAHSRHKYRWQVASPTCLHPEIRLKPRPHTARVARLLHIHNPRAEGPSQ